MPTVYRSAVVGGDAARVWAALRDFNGLPGWHPGFTASVIEGAGHAGEVGALRRITLTSGAAIRERLLALSDLERSMTYEIVESPLPITAYVATLKVTPVTATGEAFVEWRSSFDCAPDQVTPMQDLIAGVYTAGLDSLAARFAG